MAESAKPLAASIEKAKPRIAWRFMVVCSGKLLAGYGADVTPEVFLENFIGLMVDIDATNAL